MNNIKVGKIVEGQITGITKYGVFVSLEDNYTGMVHISEVSNKFVSDLEHKFTIGNIVKVKIDRPLNSKHPKYGFVYPVNYGFIPWTTSWDWEELDAYVLWVFEPIEHFTWKVIAYIHRTNDNDDKLIVVPEWINYSDEAIKALIEFQERFFESEIIR